MVKETGCQRNCELGSIHGWAICRRFIIMHSTAGQSDHDDTTNSTGGDQEHGETGTLTYFPTTFESCWSYVCSDRPIANSFAKVTVAHEAERLRHITLPGFVSGGFLQAPPTGRDCLGRLCYLAMTLIGAWCKSD